MIPFDFILVAEETDFTADCARGIGAILWPLRWGFAAALWLLVLAEVMR